MANRSERRAAEQAKELINAGIKAGSLEGVAEQIAAFPSIDEQHAALVAQMGGELAPAPVDKLGEASLTIEKLDELLAAAQLEIEALQADRARDRALIVELQGSPSVTKLSLTRDVLEDEIDEDPSESPGSAAYDGGFRAGMLRAAIICETQWSSDIGRHCAASIRAAEEKLP